MTCLRLAQMLSNQTGYAGVMSQTLPEEFCNALFLHLFLPCCSWQMSQIQTKA
jgi:hypothetical protein